MKKTNLLPRLFAVLLLGACLLSLGACQKGSSPEHLPDTKPHKNAAEFGVVEYGFIAEKNFPDSAALDKWYTSASERAEVTNSLLCAFDEKSNRWYCWLYVGDRCKNDKLSITVDDRTGCDVYLNLITSSITDNEGAYAFSLPGSAEPSFAFFVDGVGDGLIFTIGKSPVFPKTPDSTT